MITNDAKEIVMFIYSFSGKNLLEKYAGAIDISIKLIY